MIIFPEKPSGHAGFKHFEQSTLLTLPFKELPDHIDLYRKFSRRIRTKNKAPATGPSSFQFFNVVRQACLLKFFYF
jgi:hypothetical protein